MAKFEDEHGNEKLEKVFQVPVDALNWLATRGVETKGVSWTCFAAFSIHVASCLQSCILEKSGNTAF